MDDPIARVTGYVDGHCVIEPLYRATVLPTGMALYVAAKKWVGLTDEEIDNLIPYCYHDFERTEYEEVIRAVEAKLREKNGF